jgi:hypothetical protein
MSKRTEDLRKPEKAHGSPKMTENQRSAAQCVAKAAVEKNGTKKAEWTRI